MTGLAAWTIAGGKPAKLDSATVQLEQDLETWIEADPGLVDRGIVVLQRQLHLGTAGRLDLLCVDQQGRLVVMEIKRATLIRETIAQAVDYASVVAAWPAETIRSQITPNVQARFADHPGISALLQAGDDEESREVEIIIVGCGADPSVDRMIEFLGSHTLPIRAVTFDVFTLADGQRVLVREEREPETPPQPSGSRSSVEAVIAKAGGSDSPGGRRMQAIVDAGARNGLYPRPYKYSVMLAPPQKRTRYLATVWRLSRTQIVLTYSADAFEEFFPLPAEEVTAILGPDRVEFASDDEAVAWGKRLDALFAAIESKNRSEGDNGD